VAGGCPGFGFDLFLARVLLLVLGPYWGDVQLPFSLAEQPCKDAAQVGAQVFRGAFAAFRVFGMNQLFPLELLERAEKAPTLESILSIAKGLRLSPCALLTDKEEDPNLLKKTQQLVANATPDQLTLLYRIAKVIVG
jgi:hypothetical protein